MNKRSNFKTIGLFHKALFVAVITLIFLVSISLTTLARENTIPLDPDINTFLGINEADIFTESLGLLCTDDVDGANDKPGQKDLTQMCVDNSVDPIKIRFNWDEIYGGGANTYDACNMFDTDSDGNVNISFCVTVAANDSTDIMEYKNISLYSCGDDKPDRCTQPVNILTPSFGTACSVSQQNLDPFPAGADYPQDTVGTCDLVRNDAGGESAVLVNLCSFPSQQPNSDPSDCITEPGSGFITVIKDASPDLSSIAFNFAVNDGSSDLYNPVINGSGASDRLAVIEGTYSVTETVPVDWNLDKASCVEINRGAVGSPNLENDGVFEIAVQSGDDITCTFEDSLLVQPSISTTPVPSAGFVGDVLHDSASLSNGYNPGGTITFKLYSPQDQTCEGQPEYEEIVPVSGNGNYNTKTGFQTNIAGTWRWVAVYSGDDHNPPAMSGCDDEQVTIRKQSTETTTFPIPTRGIVGVILNDTADVTIVDTDEATVIISATSAITPTGDVTFRLYEPGDSECESPIFTETVPLIDSAAKTTTGYTTSLAGIYLWTAEYSGDDAFDPSQDACGDEVVIVEKDTPTITTTPKPEEANIWTRLHDTALLANGFNPTGTVTFKLYDPDDATCTDPVHTEAVELDGLKAQTIDGFVANKIGTWRWMAEYSGDVNNNPANSGCNDERVTIKNYSLFVPIMRNDFTPPICSFTWRQTYNGYQARIDLVWENAASPEEAPEAHRVKWGDNTHTKFTGESGSRAFWHTYAEPGWYYVYIMLWGHDGQKYFPCSDWVDPP